MHATLDEHEFDYNSCLYTAEQVQVDYDYSTYFKNKSMKTFLMRPKSTCTCFKTEIGDDLSEVDDDFLPCVNVVYEKFHII